MILVQDNRDNQDKLESKVKIDLNSLEKKTQIILDHLNYSDYDISIILVSNSFIQNLNKTYRDKDNPTDIISFPYHTTLKAGEKIKILEDDDKNLGDIILCPEYINQDLDRWEQNFNTRLDILLIHGICHLLGYDHIEDSDYTIMKDKESKLLDLINK